MKKYILNAIELEIAKNDAQSHDDQGGNLIGASQHSEGGFSQRNLQRGFELILKLFDQISIQDWLKIQRSLTHLHGCHFPNSDLIDLDINAKILDAVQIINENNYNVIALSTNEKSQLLGLISTHDIITFLANNYKGEVDFFSQSFTMIERSTNNVSHCSRNQNLVKASYMDTLFEVLKKMRDNQVSNVIIERSYQSKETQREVTETVGMVFLTDLMYLLRQVNFFEILTQPVMHFVMHLNGSEEDLSQFEDRLRRQGYNLGDVFGNLNVNQKASGAKDTGNLRSLEKQKPEESKGQNDVDDNNCKMEGDNEGDDKAVEEEFFNFHPHNEGMYKKPSTRKKEVESAHKAAGRSQNEVESLGHGSGIDGGTLQIDQLFGRIFGIERVHVLNKSDRLQDVLEKISIIPENKLVYVEDTPTGASKAQANDESDDDDGLAYQVKNILTLGDLLTYLCPSQQADR